jgi:hypothetical protein
VRKKAQNKGFKGLGGGEILYFERGKRFISQSAFLCTVVRKARRSFFGLGQQATVCLLKRSGVENIFHLAQGVATLPICEL